MTHAWDQSKKLEDVVCQTCKKQIDYSILVAVDESCAEHLSIRSAGA